MSTNNTFPSLKSFNLSSAIHPSTPTKIINTSCLNVKSQNVNRCSPGIEPCGPQINARCSTPQLTLCNSRSKNCRQTRQICFDFNVCINNFFGRGASKSSGELLAYKSVVIGLLDCVFRARVFLGIRKCCCIIAR